MNTDSESAGWRQISVTTSHAAMAEAVFEHFGAAAITELDAGDEPAVELTPHTRPAFALSRIVGLFAVDIAVDAVRRELVETLGADITVRIDDVARKDWADAWIAHHPPLHFGGRLWVAPHEARVDTHTDGDVIVRLDPGLAFGTGTHPTTALCLTWLAHSEPAGRTVLDYGCGSGILAIAAVLLGARRVCAVDTDEQALRATRRNAAMNNVANRIATPAIEDVAAGPHDVVLANILAQPLIDLAPTLTALTAPGGQLVLSGLLQRQTEPVRAAYSSCFTFGPPARQDDWIRLDGVKNPSNAD